MGRRLLAAAAVSATALLGGCWGTSSHTGMESSGASLCPGSRNCPAENGGDSDYVGLLLSATSFQAAVEGDVLFTKGAAPPGAAGSAPAGGGSVVPGGQGGGAPGPQTETTPLAPEKKLCPQKPGKCTGSFAKQSGVMWPTPEGEQGQPSPQIACDPGAVCVKKADGTPVLASDGAGGTMPMEAGWYGWLCKKSSGKCGDLPQKR